jgi:hypothetical protein
MYGANGPLVYYDVFTFFLMRYPIFFFFVKILVSNSGSAKVIFRNIINCAISQLLTDIASYLTVLTVKQGVAVKFLEHLLQAYLYTYSLLRGVTIKACPLNSYALSPVMLLPLETFRNS